MGYSADKSPLIGHLAGPIRRLKPLGAQRQEKGGPNHLTREGLHATTPLLTGRLAPRFRHRSYSTTSEEPPLQISTATGTSPVKHAQALIEAWRCEYNEERPKKGLGGLTPALYAKQLAAERSTVTPGL